jgi:hypothetical protein
VRAPTAGRALGAWLVGLYVVVAVGTDQLSPRPVLPLFDGFAPPTPYGWVNPPPERAGDNVAPKAAERELVLGAAGSPASNVATDDAQAIVGLDNGSVPPNPPDTSVLVRITPVDAATLGPLPPGLRVVSNAYEVRLSYVPSQTPVTRLPVKGTVALTAAEPGNRLLYSADGRAWEERAFRPYGYDHGVFAELETVGWFVVATTAGAGSEGGGSSDLLGALLLAVVVVGTVGGAALVVLLPSPVPVTKKRGGRRD